MHTIPLAAPLFIVREECQRDLLGVFQKLKSIGFDGVELVGLFGYTPEQIREFSRVCQLPVIGDHVPYRQFLADPHKVIDAHAEMGCSYITVAELPMDDFPSVAENLTRFSAEMARKNMRLLYHNHDYELWQKIEGRETLAWLMDNVPSKTLAMEIDLGWIEIGGGNCKEYLTRYRDRCPVIHLKDYYATSPAEIGHVHDFSPARGGAEHGQFEFRPTGYGVMNFPALLPLCLACKPEWLVIDHDLAYERDSFEDLRISLEYTKALLAL